VNPAQLADRVIQGEHVDRDTARALMGLDGDDVYSLLHAAHQVRMARFGRRVFLCSIVAGRVGGCGEDCRFCAQSAHHHTATQAHGVPASDEVARAAREARQRGAHCFSVVNSGRAPRADDWPALLDALREVARVSDLRCSASLGLLSDDQIDALRQAGVVRLHHNLETSERFFPHAVTTHTWQDRLAMAHRIRAAGLELCCGAIFGLGETLDDRLDVAFVLRDLHPHNVPLNFLNPIPGTPLGHVEPLAPLDILKTIAVFRLVLPGVPLTVAGGREVNLRDLQSWIFHAGATGVLIGHYLTTAGRPPDVDLKMILDLGLVVEKGV